MNKKVKKVLFILTFIPYAAVLIYGLHGAIFGANFFFSTYYGLDGFVMGAGLTAFCMVVIVPVIPVCAVFHILCLLRKFVPSIKKINIKIFAVICLVFCALAAAIPLVSFYL